MPKIVGIKFKGTPKIYYFGAGNFEYKIGQGVIVDSAKGLEYAKVAFLPKDVDDSEIVQPLKNVVRIATDKDEEKMLSYEKKRPETIKIANQKIQESKLDMKLVDAQYTFDGSKLLLYFTADNRVDFRSLVKELASTFKTRIELRQIGARDECKMLGGIAPCGRACCCSDAMSDYAHTTIKMAKNQGLSLNPSKISGLCGRLMCCLSYENEHYAETNKKMPKIGATVITKDKRSGIATAINQLKETVKVRYESNERVEILDVSLDDIIEIRGKGTQNNAQNDEPLSDELKNLID